MLECMTARETYCSTVPNMMYDIVSHVLIAFSVTRDNESFVPEVETEHAERFGQAGPRWCCEGLLCPKIVTCHMATRRKLKAT